MASDRYKENKSMSRQARRDPRAGLMGDFTMHAFATTSCGHLIKAFDDRDDWQMLVLDQNRRQIAEWWVSTISVAPDRGLRRAFESAAAHSKLRLDGDSIVIV